MENGVAVLDLGGATTSVAIFEEGDLQHVGVLPVGSNNITNDLAIVLEIDTEIAEDIKRRFVSGGDDDGEIVVRRGREELAFNKSEVNEIVKARLAEIFDTVRKELKAAKYDHKLPEGVVLVGGGARLKGIADFAKSALEASIKIGTPDNLGGVADAIKKPEYAAAVGLALMSARDSSTPVTASKKSKKPKAKKGGLKSLFKKF